MPADTETARESRLRSRARQGGLRLEKSRSRTPGDPAFGKLHLVDPDINGLVAYGLPNGFGLNLEEVEAALSE